MNISAVNCTPIKPQTSFGMATKETDEQYEKIVLAAQHLEDAFVPTEEENTKKSKLGIFTSVATAALVTYMGGKLAATKANEIFPKLAPTMENAGKLAAKDGKVASNLGKIAQKAEEGARNIYKTKLDKGEGAVNAMKNLAGTAALMLGLPKIVTVDGNKDGISDITQKNANAYKSTINNLGVVSELVDALS